MPPRTVFLLHGMGRTRLSMLVLALHLHRAGYRPVAFPYNQATQTLDEATASLLDWTARKGGGAYDMVGHSLGGVIIRNGFKTGYPPGLGRVVLLAPPNSPAGLARRLRGFPPYRWLTGDCGQKLADPRFYAGLPVPGVEFAVIAGSRGTRLLSDEPNDGILPVETTRLAGMREFSVVRHSHTFLMNAADTAALVVAFLARPRAPA